MPISIRGNRFLKSGVVGVTVATGVGVVVALLFWAILFLESPILRGLRYASGESRGGKWCLVWFEENGNVL